MKPTNVALTRNGRVKPAIRIGNVIVSAIGTSGSMRFTSRTSAGSMDAGSPATRTAIRESTCPGFCQNGVYAHGSMGFVRLATATSFTTPTT